MTKINVGDTLFNRSGDPGIVISKDPANGDLTVQKKGKNYEDSRKVGFINGLPPEQKSEYDSVIVDIRQEKKPIKRLEALTSKIEELNKDPRNFLLSKYLTAEKAHIINSDKIRLDSYKVGEDDI